MAHCASCGKPVKEDDNLYKLDGQILCTECVEEMDEKCQ